MGRQRMTKRAFTAPLQSERCTGNVLLADGSGAACMHKRAGNTDRCRQHPRHGAAEIQRGTVSKTLDNEDDVQELNTKTDREESVPLTREELSALVAAKSSNVELLVLSANGRKDWTPAEITGWSRGRTAVHVEIRRHDGSPMCFSYGTAEATRVLRRARNTR